MNNKVVIIGEWGAKGPRNLDESNEDLRSSGQRSYNLNRLFLQTVRKRILERKGK